MITLSHNALPLEPLCAYVSCHFDVEQFNEGSAAELDLILPSNLDRAVTKRKAEYLAGRWCARQALRRLLPEQKSKVIIGTGEHREPLWPAGVVGSITHSKGFAAAALARGNDVRALGIDSEYLIQEKTARNVSSHVLTEAEDFAANADLFENFEHYLTFVFSAKESIFKCLYPLVNRYFDFAAAEVQARRDQAGIFDFVLLKDLNAEFSAGFKGSGFYERQNDFTHTAVLLRNDSSQ